VVPGGAANTSFLDGGSAPPAVVGVRSAARFSPIHQSSPLIGAVSPRADLLLHGAGGRKVVVELEISRADPVANQVKFLLAHRAGALGPDDALVGMLSSHIAHGRRNACGALSRLMREVGFPAFQLSLLPEVGPGRIAQLNHLPPPELAGQELAFRPELDRLLSVVEPRGETHHRIHFAGDVTDVVANIWAWNDEIDEGGAGAEAWGRRRIQYFVGDPRTGLFAPSKFGAFIPAKRPGGPPPPATMTMQVYGSLGEQDPRFDGHVARRHLERRLAFELIEADQVGPAFERWLASIDTAVATRGTPKVLLPPDWYAPGRHS